MFYNVSPCVDWDNIESKYDTMLSSGYEFLIWGIAIVCDFLVVPSRRKLHNNLNAPTTRKQIPVAQIAAKVHKQVLSNSLTDTPARTNHSSVLLLLKSQHTKGTPDCSTDQVTRHNCWCLGESVGRTPDRGRSSSETAAQDGCGSVLLQGTNQYQYQSPWLSL